ncbi:hypothetical protein WVIC16_60046 [Weissella viridescens]|nr:hypothetical protein WVIC16_60046 [Weissella viridescens]
MHKNTQSLFKFFISQAFMQPKNPKYAIMITINTQRSTTMGQTNLCQSCGMPID